MVHLVESYGTGAIEEREQHVYTRWRWLLLRVQSEGKGFAFKMIPRSLSHVLILLALCEGFFIDLRACIK